MNILMLVTTRQNRGAEISAANLANQLIEMGHFILWVGLYSPKKNDVLDVVNATTFDLQGEKHPILSFSKTNELRALLTKYDIDIIQANGSDTFKYAVAASLFLEKPKILYRNISHVSYWMKNRLIRLAFYRQLFKKADAIVSISNSAAQDFLDIMKVDKDCLKVIKRGIPNKALNKIESRQEVNVEFKLTNSQKLIIWAGALSPEKNPLFALQIIKYLNSVRSDCTLMIVGTGSEEIKLREKINELQLNNVILTGFRSDIQCLLAASEVLILTSFVEGIPGVVLEASIQQTPTIAIDCGSVSEALIHNKTGVLIKPHNEKQFGDAIHLLLNSEVQRQEFGYNALEYVSENYNEIGNANKFVELYKKLLSQ
jgi:glycosyltransferase involved in cell wall biosynthesis